MIAIFCCLLATLVILGTEAVYTKKDGCPYYSVIYSPYVHPEYGKSYYNNPICTNYKYSLEYHNPKCNPHEKYRSLDGMCNNLFYPDWGSSGQRQLRWLPPQYDDGVSVPRIRQGNGEFLPLVRAVSVLVHDDQNNFHPSGSVILMQWGQFISHDIAATARDRDGVTIPCCDDEYVVNMTLHPDIFGGGACFPIIIPEGDRRFTNLSERCISFVRSKPDFTKGVREQINVFSAYIDGTTVYGANEGTLETIRNFTGGRMNVKGPDNLPESPSTRGCTIKVPGDYCLLAGDFRVNMLPPLGMLHTLFVRYHNYLADELAIANPHYDDEKLFQEARRIVIAVIQQITYNEYLPLILGRKAMNEFGLRTLYKYNAYCDATLHNAFLAAAYRFGHSMVPDFLLINGTDVNVVDTWFDPHAVLNFLDEVVFNSAQERAESADRWVSRVITDRLFERPSRRGSDLISTNIQRGRDHGLPGYNSFRRFCKLDPIKRFDELPNGLELKELYNDVEDIDLYTGGLSERSVKSLGPTFTCLVARQFRNLRDCDRFFWENDDPKIGFTHEQKDAIRRTRLSDVICLTTGVERIQRNVFKVNRDRLRSCARIRRRSMNIQELF